MTTSSTGPTPADSTADPTTGEEVNHMAVFNLHTRRRPTADLDRLVVLERLKRRRRAEQQLRSVHHQLWGFRANQ